MITQRQKFSYSEYFYAIDLSSLAVNNLHSPMGNPFSNATLDAIWFKRKNGLTAVCSGKLRLYSSGGHIQNFDDFAQAFDSRHGGDTEYKWDGVEMWGASNEWDGLVKAQARLAPLLEAFPEPPAGYDTWFSIK